MTDLADEVRVSLDEAEPGTPVRIPEGTYLTIRDNNVWETWETFILLRYVSGNTELAVDTTARLRALGLADNKFPKILRTISADPDDGVKYLNGLGVTSVRDVPLIIKTAGKFGFKRSGQPMTREELISGLDDLAEQLKAFQAS